jgi:mono/diheme cytochrome c family protein
MPRRFLSVGLIVWTSCRLAAFAGLTPGQLAQLPPPAAHPVDFAKEIKPIIEKSCINCHGHGRDKGGFRFDTRETALAGGESGAAIVPGQSAESSLIALVAGVDPDNVMPQKGTRLTPEQVGLLRAWIDQGAAWAPGITFGKAAPQNLKPRLPAIPAMKAANPVDSFIGEYFATHQIAPPPVVSDRLYARRVYLDILGVLPPPAELEQFLADRHPNKRERLVDLLLADNRNYAEQWLTFWNDLLRNDYRGTGYIDGGRKQITRWLYTALLTNMPYDGFVADLINPGPESEGFSKGIVWRGVVNASQTPQMQTAQNISQVFMGVNLKCASCHDSFVNDLTLADAYGLAGIYSDGPLEMVHCDKPTGKKADLKFLYPELGALDPAADKPARLKRLAEIVTGRQDGRLTRTLVNRLWQRFMGRGLIEPVDDMEKKAWEQDLLDWLAEDFAAHNYDVKHLVRRIVTSRAYQLPAVNVGEQTGDDFVFTGPAVRRLSAEQFRDALTALTGVGYSSPAADVAATDTAQRAFSPVGTIKWIWNDPHAAEKAKPGRVCFRKTVILPEMISDAVAVVLCDNTFTLYVNGKKAGAGSDFKEPSLFDIRNLLTPGTNVFVIEAVNNLPDNTAPDSAQVTPDAANPAGLLFYARLRTPAKGKSGQFDFGSDDSWTCSAAPAENWRTSTAAATNWARADVLGDIGMIPWRGSKAIIATRLATLYPGSVRASLVPADALMVALARPNREQVVTTRASAATTLQALELTNGETLSDILKRGAKNLLEESDANKSDLVPSVYAKALGRKPTPAEMQLALDIIGTPAQPAGVEDLLWTMTMLPEFQLIY